MIPQKFPEEVRSFNDPKIELWRDIYGWIDNIDTVKTNILIDSMFENFKPTKECRAVVCTSFEADPRVEALVTLANQYNDIVFVWLTDSNVYDFQLPANIVHIKYKHWHLRVKTFLDLYPIERLCRAKDKKIKYKFSSLSYYPRQNRALVTALLQTYASEQSILSWRSELPKSNLNSGFRITTEFDYDLHQYLVDSLKTNSRFSDLDWSVLNHTVTIDDYKLDNNYVEYNTIDINNPCYQNTLINFSNETTSFGYFNDGTIAYTRPGPYLTEKTLKPLLTGTILLNAAQPHVYEFLKNDYHLPIDYCFDTSYDELAGDFDRYRSLVDLGKTLADTPLQELIDKNIDNCELIQNTLLSPEWLSQIKLHNQQQDVKIINVLEKV